MMKAMLLWWMMNNLSYYGINNNAFKKDIDADNLYESGSYKEGMLRLNYLKNVQGIGLIIGNTGVGKTTLIRGFVNKLNKEKYNVIYISLINSKKFEFMTLICKSLGISLGDCYLSSIKTKIQKEIIKQKKEEGKDTVIIIDNGEKISSEILTDINYLYEFEYDSEDYTSILFCGNSSLKDELKRSAHESLKQRLLFSYKLEELTKNESKEYIKTRLELGEQSKMIFTDTAINALHNASEGNIRKINTLINLCLIIGYQNKKEIIDEEIVRIAIEESEL